MHDSINNEELKNVIISENEVVCELNDRFSIIVIRKHRKPSHVLLKSGKRRLKLPMEIFDAICNSKISVLFLKQFLDNIK